MNLYRKRVSFLSLLVISSLSLTACESLSKIHLGPKLGIKIPIQEEGMELEDTSKDPTQLGEGESSSKQTEPSDNVIFTQLDNDENIKTEIKAMQSEEFVGTGEFMAKTSRPGITQSTVDGKYSINFDAADIGEVSKIILSDMLEENYILSPAVKGSITLQTTKPLYKDDLLPTLEMLLRANGAVLVKRNGVYRIEPGAQGAHTADASILVNEQLGPGYQVKVIPLQYVGAVDMADVLKPVVPPNAILRMDLARNLLFVAGTKEELEKIINLVNIFDVNFIKGMSFGLYPLENTEVSSTVAEIEAIFNNGELTPLSGMIKFISIKHLNAILVMTQQREYLKEAKKWIDRLDKQNGVIGEGGVIVYKVQHVDATELAATLTSVISGIAPTKSKSVSVAPGQSLARIDNRVNKPPKTAKVTTSRAQGNASLEGVNIIADEANNALIIMAEPQQYRTLSKIIKHLDVMPLQVLIDATIVAVSLDDGLGYGVEWLFKNSGPGDLQGKGSGGGLPTVGGLVADAALGGFTYGLVSNGSDVRLIFTALATDKKINVLSAPSLMVLNNQEATIKVGNSVPIRTSESTNTSGGGANPIQTSSIEMLDTGVILKVKPRVNATGQVVLEIDQSVDSASKTTGIGGTSNIDSPTILQRQIQTTVAVVSGESIVLGGLINEQHTYENNGIPFFKDIPYIGWLFGNVSKVILKDELIVVITPSVVANRFDARKVTDEFKRKLTGIYYDEDVWLPGSDQSLRGYNGLEIQTEEQREAPLAEEE
ncbi:MAG: type II secretion system secretin GspD [Gammaproteobacteria bacterium]|nr:type II secretion system secretin GspD [Gammaproteobacteria bacterium]MBT5827017.1 type II secretion system secretin GspD [Gammaproteobacteria bacterium]MBT5967144.1 type II secretion system secretin GspD [Gammaproteobacteria bacterium]MBT6420023.1 type II secretion system secretin GspD [Gammaproteobacteria bacterium]MBT6575991.1 type II secretion system secretin GspD [Gammaproteobacteria bacterium]